MNTLAAIARIATTRKSNEVAEVACRDKGNELSVTETGMSFDCPPPLTVILPEPPMSPAKNDAVRPSDATSTRPTDVVQVKLGTDTVFPYASTAVTVRVSPATVATLIEFVATTRRSKDAGVTVTAVNAARPETVAVTRTGPACCGAVRMPDEIPIEPADATQVAVDPAIEFPFASVTTAVKARVPVAATLDWGALIATAAGGPARIATVILAVGTPDTPPAEIVPMPPVTVHTTVRPEIALPKASLGVPLKARVPPATTVPVGGDTSIRASGPATIVTAKSCVFAPAAIVKVPVPARHPLTVQDERIAVAPVSGTDPIVVDHR